MSVNAGPMLLLADLATTTSVVNTAVATALGNAFTNFTGPTTSIKTFTLPNANATILTDNAAVTVAQGGTGRATALAYGVLCGGTTATGAHQSVASVGTAEQVLTSAGAGALPVFANPHLMLISQTVTAVDVNNTDAETTVFTQAVAANSLSTNRRVLYEGFFKATSATGAPDIVVKVKYGALVATLPTIVLADSQTDAAMLIRATLIALTANSQVLVVEVKEMLTGATLTETLTRAAGAIDSTASQDFIVTIQPASAVADTTVTMEKSTLCLAR